MRAQPSLNDMDLKHDSRMVISQPTGAGRPRTAAVIVTYHPPPALRDNIASLYPQVDEVVIVDNGSGANPEGILERIGMAFTPHTILNGVNLGMGEALNHGMDYAATQLCDMVLLLDQDSVVRPDYIKEMLATYTAALEERNPASRTVGMVVPTYIDEQSGVPMPLAMTREGTVLTGMTSGTMVPMSTYRRCGPFDESLFIDYVDIEYCLRVWGCGFTIVQSKSAILLHNLGNHRSYSIGGVSFSSSHHSAARRYYISRNRMVLYRRYLVTRPGWVVRDLRAMVMETIKIVLVEDDRWRKLYLTLKGIGDGIRNRMGYRVEL